MYNQVLKKNSNYIIAIVLLYIVAHMEYNGFRTKSIIYPIIWILFAVTIKRLFRANTSTALGVFYGIGCFGYIVLTLFFMLSKIMCAWSQEDILYEHKKYPSIQLTKRGWGCLLTDDDYPYYKKYKLTENIAWISEFNDLPVDTTEWKRI